MNNFDEAMTNQTFVSNIHTNRIAVQTKRLYAILEKSFRKLSCKMYHT